jgi:hypothetical protein
MSVHRFRHLTNRITFPVPQPAPTAPTLIACPACFLTCGIAAQQQWMQAVYREAYEKARDNLRPAWLRNDRVWAFN